MCRLSEKVSPIFSKVVSLGIRGGCMRGLSEKVSHIVRDTSKAVWHKHEPSNNPRKRI